MSMSIDKNSLIHLQAQPYVFSFIPDKTALLIIDVQRDFVYPGGFGEMLGNKVEILQKVINPIQKILKCFREKGLMIIFTKEAHKPDLSDLPETKRERGNLKVRIGDEGPMGRVLIAGEYGNDIVDELKPLPSEVVISKPGKGSFYKTNLEETLNSKGIKSLIIAGVTTEVCVKSTVIEANDRGYECLVLEDCVASYFPEFYKSALDMIKAQGAIFGWVTNSKELLKAIKAN